jgi:hypothetical protein
MLNVYVCERRTGEQSRTVVFQVVATDIGGHVEAEWEAQKHHIGLLDRVVDIALVSVVT